MDTPPGTDPPYVPIRHGAWATRRTPRWLLLPAALLVVVAVLVGLAHRPSRAQRASDLRGFVTDMRFDIESCAGGVSESLTALHQIDAGTSRDVGTAINIAEVGSANCSPANNELIDDLEGYQVTESLDSFHLQTVVTGLVTWAAPDAAQVQADVGKVLAARVPAARSQAIQALSQGLAKLDAQRSAVDSVIQAASRSLSATVTPLDLPG